MGPAQPDGMEVVVWGLALVEGTALLFFLEVGHGDDQCRKVCKLTGELQTSCTRGTQTINTSLASRSSHATRYSRYAMIHTGEVTAA